MTETGGSRRGTDGTQATGSEVDVVDRGTTSDDRKDGNDSPEVDSPEVDSRDTDPDLPENDPERVEFLLVAIDGERYAIERGRLRRVVEPAPVTRVPRTPEIVRGVTQISGEVAAVVDARRLFDRPAGDVETGRFVLLERDPHETALALSVDAVEMFETIHVDRISIDVDGDLLRASIDADEDDAHESAEAPTESPDGGSTSDSRPTSDSRSIPIVDVDALFAATTV